MLILTSKCDPDLGGRGADVVFDMLSYYCDYLYQVVLETSSYYNKHLCQIISNSFDK
jgi:hypothetical protein